MWKHFTADAQAWQEQTRPFPSRIDYAVGILLHAKVADRVEAGQPLFTIHANDHAKAIAAEERLRRTITIGAETVEPLPLFYGLVS